MHVAITGGTGLVGQALTQALRARGDTVTIVTRSPEADDEIGWDPGQQASLELPERTTQVVHLAGAPIVGQRWTEAYKRELLESRVEGTARVVEAVASHGAIEHVVSGSAVGYYGDRGEQTLTEEDPPAGGFLANVCQRWEEAAIPIAKDDTLDTGLAWIRTGVVLSSQGGALAQMLNPIPLVRPFHWGLGGPVGDGEQWFPWIHIEDEVGAILHLLDEGLEGPFNLTSPGVTRNRTFTRALGLALNRPTKLPVPRIALKALYGESAQVLFDSQCVLPSRLERSGYTFQHANIQEALHDLLASN